MITRLQALQLLSRCRGDEVWSLEYCRSAGVPDSWFEELADALESGFDSDQNTLYVNERVVNQYHGLSDLKLAFRIAEFLGFDTSSIRFQAYGRIAQVNAIKELIDEG